MYTTSIYIECVEGVERTWGLAASSRWQGGGWRGNEKKRGIYIFRHHYYACLPTIYSVDAIPMIIRISSRHSFTT